MISSLLDNDMYQFTMSNAIWRLPEHRDVQVKYAFRNRTFSVPLAARIDLKELQELIDEIRGMKFRAHELSYLQSLGYFSDDWLIALSHTRLPEVDVRDDDGHLVMEYEGPWWEAIFWETPLLSIVNELYFREFGTFCHREGNLRLKEKIEYLRDRGTIRFVEFGTRRRFSQQWQQHVLNRLMTELGPDIVLGTSNVALAKEQQISPVGTMAHQMFMVQAALKAKFYKENIDPPYEDDILYHAAMNDATAFVTEIWATFYAPHLMVALPDTFTTKEFFDAAANDDVRDSILKFNSFRQDSGDPIKTGEKILENYWYWLRRSRLGIKNPQVPGPKPELPTIIFSDSLDIRKMSIIEDHFQTKCKTLFGWGTDLTNDLGIQPLSIVIKPDSANGEPCVKLSDDLAKATGDPATVAAYRKAIET